MFDFEWLTGRSHHLAGKCTRLLVTYVGYVSKLLKKHTTKTQRNTRGKRLMKASSELKTVAVLTLE